MTGNKCSQRRGSRQAVGTALALTVVLFLSPLLFVGAPHRDGSLDSPPTLSADPAAARDKGRPVRLLHKDGTVEELSMEDYLWGVVAAEMPASFEPEALKAQACAARTYTVILQNSDKKRHPEADICTDSGCCQAYTTREAAQTRWGLSAKHYTEKIRQAVAQTDGLGILYQGRPIQALFFSSAAGQTVDAVEVWGNQVDYLKSVDSPEGEEVPNYQSEVVLTAEEVRSKILAAYPNADLSGDPKGWFGTPVRGTGGTVTSLMVGGLPLTGGQVRKLFRLRSAAFDLSFDGGSFRFQVTGYGHGVGMSQYGANAMAAQGKSFRDILTWYYTGVEVANLW